MSDIVEVIGPLEIVETVTETEHVVEVYQGGEAIDVFASTAEAVTEQIQVVEVYNQHLGIASGVSQNTDGGNPFTNTKVPVTSIVNLSTAPGMTFVLLTWGMTPYFNHKYVEIWRSKTDDREVAILVGTSASETFMDTCDAGVTYYYWARPVSLAGIKGNWSAVAGVSATTGQQPQNMVNALNGIISESALTAALTARLSGIESLSEDLQVEVTNRTQAIIGEASARQTALSAEEAARNTAIGQEVLNRDIAIAAAVANEAAVRSSAIITEAAIRVNAEENIASLMNMLTSRQPLANNLLDMTGWRTGVVGNAVGINGGTFIAYGEDGGEDSIQLLPGPMGGDQPIWVANSVTLGDKDGGWNYTNISVDHTQSYRSTVWVYKSNTQDGQTFFGCSPTNTTDLAGAPVGDPYFWFDDLPQYNKWYLLVGVIHGSGYAGSYSGIAGVYDPVDGTKVIDGVEFKNLTGATIQTHRAYLANTTSDNVVQRFAHPRFELIDGNEITLSTLLKAVDQMASIQELFTAADGTNAQWTIRTDVNGRVAGVGLMNDGSSSIFEIIADNFSVLDPDDPTKVVIGASNGVAVINGAFITTASIQSTSIRAAAIKSAHIESAAIGSVHIASVIQSDNYDATLGTGWSIYKSGVANFNEVNVKGTVTGSRIIGSIIDGGVFIGDTDITVPTDVDTGAYPRYLCYASGLNITYSESGSSSTNVYAVATTNVKSAGYEGEGTSDYEGYQVYTNFVRYAVTTIRPLITFSSNGGAGPGVANSSYTATVYIDIVIKQGVTVIDTLNHVLNIGKPGKDWTSKTVNIAEDGFTGSYSMTGSWGPVVVGESDNGPLYANQQSMSALSGTVTPDGTIYTGDGDLSFEVRVRIVMNNNWSYGALVTASDSNENYI